MVTELECWRMSRASFDDIEGAGVLDTGLGSGGDFELSEEEDEEGARSPPRARAKKVAVAQTAAEGGGGGGEPMGTSEQQGMWGGSATAM
jgi:hypothetical protein